MKPWIKRTLFGLFGATIIIGSLTACGPRYGHDGWNVSAEDRARFRERMIERVSGKLELDEDQKKRLVVLADKLHEQRSAFAGQAGDTRAEVQSLVAGDKFDRARAQALVSGKVAAVTAGSPEVIAALADFYDGLTAAQQAKVREFMQHRRGWRRHG